MYLVVWTDNAFDEMAAIIRDNRERKEELSAALQGIALRLRLDANTTGESRGGNLRVIIVDPLTVYYLVEEDIDAVEVIRVRARFRA